MKHFGKAIIFPLLMLTLLLSACGGKSAKSADLKALYEKIGSSLELPEMLELSEQRIQTYYGIDPAACKQLLIAVSDDGLRVDEIWLIEAADEKAAEQILAAARSRIEQVCSETENYLPDQYAVAKNGEALQIGSSVALFLSPDAKEMANLFTQAFQ